MRQLADICDVDGDGVEFNEFCNLIGAEDALPLLKARRQRQL
jgi:hypothetical protein